MTAQEAAVKRNEKAQSLKVWQVDDTWFYVESEEGKIAYKCCVTDRGDFCNCGDFATKSKNDPSFKCKHLLAVINSIPRNEVLEAQFLDKRKPRLDERFIKNIDGKDFALYVGLLDLAHQKNLISMEVELLQFPSAENVQTAICRAIGKTAGGGIFIDIGDANPQNCNAKVSRHIIRMASTRAKARCLRDMTNIGMTCLEELGDLTEVIGADDETGKTASGKRDNVRKFQPKQSAQQVQPVQSVNENGGKHVTTEPTPVKAESALPLDTSATPHPQVSTGKTETAREDTKPSGAHRATAKAGQTVKSGNGKDKSDKSDKIPMMSEAQKSAIYNLSRRRGISVEDLENMATKSFNVPVENLTHENAVIFIRTLQQAA